MKHTVLEPLGAIVEDIAVGGVGLDVVSELRALLAEHGVLILPDQNIDDRAFVAFLKSFGALSFTAGEIPVEGFPDLNLISNVGRTNPPRSTFHVDTSYIRRPPAYTALRAVDIPVEGGETLFTNQYLALQTLPRPLRDRLEGRTITHVVTGLDLDSDAETSAEHPVFRPHPLSGRRALYLSTPARCQALSGMSEVEARETVQLLFDHSTNPANVLRHRWSAGDVVMWDNGCVLHRADHSGVVGDRVMHRGMVGAYS